MQAVIRHCYRYPIKGFTAEPLPSLSLAAGEGLAGDRAYAIERVAGRFDMDAPAPLGKQHFVMLMRDARLALLRARYADNDKVMITGPDLQSPLLDLTQADDREKLARLVAEFLDDPKLTPRVVNAEGHKFTDVSVTSATLMRAVSLINLNTLRAAGKALEAPLDHRRFRANLYFDGVPAWSEFEWVGRTLSIGQVELEVLKRTQRCAATEVNPDTAQRDVAVPRGIRQHFGHTDMGIYAAVKTSGTIAVDAVLRAPD